MMTQTRSDSELTRTKLGKQKHKNRGDEFVFVKKGGETLVNTRKQKGSGFELIKKQSRGLEK